MTAGEWGHEIRETLAFVWATGGKWFAYGCVVAVTWILTLRYWPWRKGPKGE